MGVCTARLSRECVSLWGPRWQAGLWEVRACLCMCKGGFEIFHGKPVLAQH